MNNTFSFERFGKVLTMDFKNYIRNFGISLLVMCCMPAAHWILSLLFGIDGSTILRGIMIFVVCCFGVILAPVKVYGKANLPREGVAYAMLPASSLEKFLSMFVFCAIVTPIVCLAGGWLIDTLLTVLPFGGFKEYVNMFAVNKIFDDAENVGDLIQVVTPFKMWYSIVLGMLFWSAVFMLGNMLFKKRKVGKTLGCYLGISYVLSTLISLIFFTDNSFMSRVGNMAADDALSFLSASINWSLVVSTILLLVMLYFVYRKIKTPKY